LFSFVSAQQPEFEEWTLKHGKTYKDQAEREFRFNTFKQNLETIQNLQEQSPNAIFGATKFADLTPEEFRTTYLIPRRSKLAPIVVDKRGIESDVPSQFDWRTYNVITRVYDQRQCSSSAYPVVENIESVWMIYHNRSIENFPPLSIQQVADCSVSSCVGGIPDVTYDYIKQCGGLESIVDYPSKPGTCIFDRKKVSACIRDYTNRQYTSEVKMQRDVIRLGPMVVSVDASSWQMYVSGVLSAAQCGTNIDHSVQVVGFDVESTPSYWLLRNSWSEEWGENGYIRIEFGKNACGVTEEVLTATVKSWCKW